MKRSQEEIQNQIINYFNCVIEKYGNNGSYLSWEHCYRFFHKNKEENLDCNLAVLHLGFYLASWGMYRGSSAIRNYDYRIHIPAIKILNQHDTSTYFHISDFSEKNIQGISRLYSEIASYYQENVRHVSGRGNTRLISTETLVTKILLGTLGCTPAYDRFVKSGLNVLGIKNKFNLNNFKEICDFCRKNTGISAAQYCIGRNYPIMRIFDIFCHSEHAKHNQAG